MEKNNQDFSEMFKSEFLANNKVILMRHATSEVNNMMHKNPELKNDRKEYMSVVMDPSNKDPPLTDTGIKEA